MSGIQGKLYLSTRGELEHTVDIVASVWYWPSM